MPHHDHQFDPERLAQMEDSRRKVFPPEETLAHFLTRPDLVIADIGCGPGFYAIPAAKMIPAGHVMAVDRQADMLVWTQQRAREAGIANLTTVQSLADDLPFSDTTFDAVLMANVLHDLPDYGGILKEVLRILKPGGIYFLVEWDKVETAFGPPLDIRFAPEELEALLQSYKFAAVHTIAAPSPWYQMSAKKPEE